eukprot:gene1006-1977_t
MQSHYFHLIYIIIFLLSFGNTSKEHGLSTSDIITLREETREAFFHSLDSYLTYGYPHDEVMPISCQARRFDERTRGDLDDVLGGYMLTLVDSLDTLLMMREVDRFRDALKRLDSLSFNRDVVVSVFEANIRVLGGLLSAHQLALVVLNETEYDGISLLNHAKTLGDKLLPAFSTATGIPVHRINLNRGKVRRGQRHTCTAAGGTFLLEMGLLSRLTGNPVYETAAFNALQAIWTRRSSIGLVGALIDTTTGVWIHTHTGIGAGIDSFYETMLKSHILLGDERLRIWFEEAYVAVQSHTNHKGWNLEVSMNVGSSQLHSVFISSLQAFWPALQTLAGDVTAAKLTFKRLLTVWKKYFALPDIFNMQNRGTHSFAKDYPLRPEMIESAYYLYGATKDAKYLSFGKDVLWSLQNRSRVSCGYASIADVDTGQLDDRMDSYFLAETLKYLFLLFDEALPIDMRGSLFCQTDHHSSSHTTTVSSEKNSSIPSSYDKGSRARSHICVSKLHTVMSTEGHVFLIDQKLRPLSSNSTSTSTSTSNQNSFGFCSLTH